MPWIPVEDVAGLQISFESSAGEPGTNEPSFADSTVTALDPVFEPGTHPGQWSLFVSNAEGAAGDMLFRVTVTDYESKEVGVQPFLVKNNGAIVFTQENESSGTDAWVESPFETGLLVVQEGDELELTRDPGESDSDSGRFLIEIWQGDEPGAEDMNCDCDETYERKTLLQMYQRVMRRMGYASQLARPPPGVKETVFDYIREAQTLTIADFDEIGHKRFFKWDMATGQRFYSLDENVDTCTKLLNALTIMGVWVRRGGQEKGIFNRLRRMEPCIPPEWYSGGIYNSWPTHYAQRSCLEVWPPPSEPMELIILGKYKNLALEEDADFTTADPEAIFLRAIAFYKAAKGHPDAEVYMGQYGQYIGNLNADQHRDVRNVPPWDVDGLCVDRYLDDRLVRVMDPLVYGS